MCFKGGESIRSLARAGDAAVASSLSCSGSGPHPASRPRAAKGSCLGLKRSCCRPGCSLGTAVRGEAARRGAGRSLGGWGGRCSRSAKSRLRLLFRVLAMPLARDAGTECDPAPFTPRLVRAPSPHAGVRSKRPSLASHDLGREPPCLPPSPPHCVEGTVPTLPSPGEPSGHGAPVQSFMEAVGSRLFGNTDSRESVFYILTEGVSQEPEDRTLIENRCVFYKKRAPLCFLGIFCTKN